MCRTKQYILDNKHRNPPLSTLNTLYQTCGEHTEQSKQSSTNFCHLGTGQSYHHCKDSTSLAQCLYFPKDRVKHRAPNTCYQRLSKISFKQVFLTVFCTTKTFHTIMCNTPKKKNFFMHQHTYCNTKTHSHTRIFQTVKW